jgi:hypothetical protein
MHAWTRSPIPSAVLFLLATLPAIARAQTLARPTAAKAVPTVEPRFVLEIEGGAGYTSVDAQKYSETITPLSDWNTTAYTGGARLFFARAGSLRLGAEAGYSYFFWYNTGAAGYPITREPHATRVGAVARAALSPRIAADAGVAAYIFPGGTVVGANAALGYFVPLGPKLSIPVRVRVDVPFTSAAMVVGITGTVGLSYRY